MAVLFSWLLHIRTTTTLAPWDELRLLVVPDASAKLRLFVSASTTCSPLADRREGTAMRCELHHAAETADGGTAQEKVSGTFGLWYVGVILSIVGSICTNMGVNLQKFSFMREAKKSIRLKRTYARQPLWVIGLLLVVGGSALDFVGLGFLPQSLATPIGGSTMIANVVFASLILKEKFSRMDAVATALVLSGICIVAAFATKESACYTVDELVSLYSEQFFILYMIASVLACAVLYVFTKRVERTLKDQGSTSAAYKRFARIHPITYPALSGIFGAQSELFAKSAAELIKTTIEGTNQFTQLGTYGITLSMFACIFLQIHWLAQGLQSFDAVFVVPVFQCFFISVSIFGGGIYFKEFASMSTLSLVMFFTGVCVTLSGVGLLSRRKMNLLRPSGKLRAAAQMIIFIKRTQKARNIEHRWTQPTEKECHSAVTVLVTKPLPSAAKPANKLSKVSVMPLNRHSSDSVGKSAKRLDQ